MISLNYGETENIMKTYVSTYKFAKETKLYRLYVNLL